MTTPDRTPQEPAEAHTEPHHDDEEGLVQGGPTEEAVQATSQEAAEAALTTSTRDESPD